MLERYFKMALARKGFGEVEEVRWSLNSCQGDGMSFSGSYDSNQLKSLLEHVYRRSNCKTDCKATDRVKRLFKLNEALAFIARDDSSITLKFNDHRYVHYNTIYADWALGTDYEHEQPYDEACQRIEEIASEIQAYARDVARDLEGDGYAIMDGTPYEPECVWEFRTRQFLVRLIEKPDPHSVLTELDDDEFFWEALQSIMAGKERYLSLEAQVYEVDDGAETIIGEDALWGIHCNVDDRTYGGNRRELISNAIAYAKEEMNSPKDTVKKAA